MLKVAISGYNGFIAQHLEKVLKRYEYGVVGIPRKVLYDVSGLERFFHINKPDFIVQTAAYGNSFNQTDEMETIYANVMTLTNMLLSSRNINYQGFINFSSSSVTLPYETFYSATKAGGERIVRAFVNKYDKPVLSIRPYTVIGVGEQSEHLIPALIRSCLLRQSMKFVKEPVHDFISVDDLCEGIVTLFPVVSKLKGQIVDIGTGVQTSNEEVKGLVEKVTGKPAVVEYVDSLRPYDAGKWVANPVILNTLGWKAKQSVEDTISQMVKG